ncbi:MAG TPA: cupin domain-containing protein [Xanthobacteraceae bacterium]|nr:cupin domain-containing protein [Xanthobacteraceae bacterium]
MKPFWIAAALAALVCVGAAGAQPVPSPVSPSPVKRTMLGKVEVPGASYDVVTALVELQPGFKAGRHNHPGTVQFEVLDGEFWLAPDGAPEKVFKTGEFGEIPSGLIHNEGAAGSTPAKLLAIYVVERGKPLVNPVK